MPFGSEVGMEKYIMARPDIFPIGPDGTMRSNRVMSQAAGHYAVDAFSGQHFKLTNLVTVPLQQPENSGFGGAPNMACNAPGKKTSLKRMALSFKEDGMRESHWGQFTEEKTCCPNVESFGKNVSSICRKLDAFKLQAKQSLRYTSIMIYGDDITHIVTEEGIAYTQM